MKLIFRIPLKKEGNMFANTEIFKRKSMIWITLLLAAGLILGTFTVGHAASTPLISISSIKTDTSVTINGTNFPKGQTFTVRMGTFGTLGVGGTVVGTVDTGTSTTFTKTFDIPSGLKGAGKIAIRLDSPQGYYSYNWFVNNTSATATTTPAASTPAATSTVSGYKGIPTFSVIKVVKGKSVTIRTSNFPAAQTFTARMGKYGTLGVGGTSVGTTDSGKGGIFEVTYDIPSGMASASKIAIRLESSAGFFAYNWFDNVDFTAGSTPSTSTATGTPGASSTPVPGYSGIPKIFINAVVKDNSVTVQGSNFPADQKFTVLMGAYGTLGVGGSSVGTYDSGKGGSFTATYTIPSGLAGSSKIAIRFETSDGHFFSYNWFYNNTTTK
jgi:hypothetical protein